MERGVSAREPIFNVPGPVLAVLAVLLAVHAGRTLLSPEDDAHLVYALAFIPARYQGFASQLPGGEAAKYTSLVTHLFVHGDWTHLAFNGAWLLAFGGAVAQRVGALRFFAFALVTGIAGALAFFALNADVAVPVVGASGVVAGLMGGTMRFFFSALDSGGLRALREAPRAVALTPLKAALLDRRVLLVSAAFVLVNVLVVLGLNSDLAPGGIAWEAHIGGYFAGLLAFGFFDRPLLTMAQPSRH
jgi:membrane associated rhomboid family serine protease